MTTSSNSDAIDLINLAERMGIPADEAMRQLAMLVADVDHPVVLPVVADAVREAVPSSAVA